jgi:acyl transferase domain-containing protein/acyl carrier protein
MRKTIFLYSGEGTSNTGTGYKLAKTSSYWAEIEGVLRDTFDIDLEKLWQDEIGAHRCPNSPLLTVINQICLADIWKKWGYAPDAVIGHSIGELSAALEAGFYSLEDVLRLTFQIGHVTARLDGVMMHGTLADRDIENLGVTLSSKNFYDNGGKHVTVSGYGDEMDSFLAEHPGFTEMRPPHPWHHCDYGKFSGSLEDVTSKAASGALFVSGVTADFEDSLQKDHWRRWLGSPIDFITAIDAIKKRFQGDEIDVIEIGFHPVLEKCCEVFDSYNYASSMYRGEDEFVWILHQRKKLDQDPFLGRLRQTIDIFRPGVEFAAGLAYQDFTSRTFVEFTAVLEPYFPGLAPQDFYRYKSVDQLIDQFGSIARTDSRSAGSVAKQEVVVAGMSCKFPEAAENPAQFWDTLLKGGDQVRADTDRGDFEAGFLGRQASKFDHKYFNISDAEARAMDPQQIMALELTEMLWKDSGVDPAALDRSRVGVYIGVWNEEYSGDKSSVYYPTGTNPSIVASRISYHYDLRGPSWVSNTACSSSLVALHYACKDIEAGRVDYAIAGGVNMILGTGFTGNMGRSGFLSKDGRCKSFDDSANGYVRAEGGGLVLLVRKDLADRYYASVRGSAINQNGGRAQVITAPHPEAQEEVILDACREADVDPGDINYIECHGTGTKIGDPIEVSAIQNTIAKNRTDVCYLGSVKSNIGHLESAAGIAGLIKSLLILNNGAIPPNLHFTKPNQFIDFETFHLKVVAEETPLDHQSLVGVSSFGFGGANAHVVLAGAEESVRKAVVDLPVPFDRNRALALSEFYRTEQGGEGPSTGDQSDQPKWATAHDVRKLVEETYAAVTNIREIDPDIELTDQGLDSLGATQFVTTLEETLGIELDSDLLFDYPLLDQLVGFLEGNMPSEAVYQVVERLFNEVTLVESIDPDVDLTDQGLDSMSALQFITRLEEELKIPSLEADLLFDCPLIDQLVEHLVSKKSAVSV